jgi:hypothetical protein
MKEIFKELQSEAQAQVAWDEKFCDPVGLIKDAVEGIDQIQQEQDAAKKLKEEQALEEVAEQQIKSFKKLATARPPSRLLTALGKAAGKLLPVLDVITTACSIHTVLAKLQAAWFGWLARDPPDPNYETIATPAKQPHFKLKLPSRARRGRSGSLAHTLDALLANEASLSGVQGALLHSVERAQGAAEEHNAFWEQRQRLAAADYCSRLARLSSKDAALRLRAKRTLKAAHLPRKLISLSRRGKSSSGIHTALDLLASPELIKELHKEATGLKTLAAKLRAGR